MKGKHNIYIYSNPNFLLQIVSTNQQSCLLGEVNRGFASNSWFDDNKRLELLTNTVTQAIQNIVMRETYLLSILTKGVEP